MFRSYVNYVGLGGYTDSYALMKSLKPEISALETLNGGKFTLSTQLIKTKLSAMSRSNVGLVVGRESVNSRLIVDKDSIYSRSSSKRLYNLSTSGPRIG